MSGISECSENITCIKIKYILFSISNYTVDNIDIVNVYVCVCVLCRLCNVCIDVLPPLE